MNVYWSFKILKNYSAFLEMNIPDRRLMISDSKEFKGKCKILSFIKALYYIPIRFFYQCSVHCAIKSIKVEFLVRFVYKIFIVIFERFCCIQFGCDIRARVVWYCCFNLSLYGSGSSTLFGCYWMVVSLQ